MHVRRSEGPPVRRNGRSWFRPRRKNDIENVVEAEPDYGADEYRAVEENVWKHHWIQRKPAIGVVQSRGARLGQSTNGDSGPDGVATDSPGRRISSAFGRRRPSPGDMVAVRRPRRTTSSLHVGEILDCGQEWHLTRGRFPGC